MEELAQHSEAGRVVVMANCTHLLRLAKSRERPEIVAKIMNMGKESAGTDLPATQGRIEGLKPLAERMALSMLFTASEAQRVHKSASKSRQGE